MRARIFSIRLTDTEWALLEERANKENRSVGNLVRTILFGGLSGPTPSPRISPQKAQAARDQLLNAMKTRSPR